MIYGERVKQLREMHRLTQTDLANTIPDLKQSHLSRIESGLAPQPDKETMALLALSLGVTPQFFERPPTLNLQAHTPQFRARTRLTQGAKAAAFQWARLVYEFHHQLRQQANRLPVRLQPVSGASPAEAARYVRDVLGFTAEEPLPYLILAAERAGITVLGLPYTVDALDAFCAWRDDEPIIAVLNDAPGDRLRFSVAHELGHLVLHRVGQTGQEIEAEADHFAAELLTPLNAISQGMPSRPTLSSLTMLKTEWGVSIKTLVRRARELGIIDQTRATSLYKQISARGWNRGEPGHVPLEKPRALRKLAEIVYGPGPNIDRLAADADWSHELALEVLDQHATADELPYQQPSRSDAAHRVRAYLGDKDQRPKLTLAAPVDREMPLRAARLRELGLGQGPDPELDEFARELAHAARELSGSERMPFAMVNFVTDRQYLSGLYAPPSPDGAVQLGRQLPLHHGYCPHVVVRRKSLILDDVCDYPQFARNPIVDTLGIQTYVGAPLIDRKDDSTGTALGTICLYDSEPRHWGHPGLSLIKDRAEHLMKMICRRTIVG